MWRLSREHISQCREHISHSREHIWQCREHMSQSPSAHSHSLLVVLVASLLYAFRPSMSSLGLVCSRFRLRSAQGTFFDEFSCVTGNQFMSFAKLPETTISDVCLFHPSLYVLATVDARWNQVVGCAKRQIIDAFLCSDFDVHCLGDLFSIESVRKHRLDKLCRLRLGRASDDVEREVLFWYEAQLHLGLLCRRNVTSLRDVLRRCFSYSSFSTYSFDGLFPVRALREGMHLRIPHWHFHDGGLVNARSMGCEQLARSVNEVLGSLWCMKADDCYCSCRTEQCGVSFRSISFKDRDFSPCSSCGFLLVRPERQPYMCSACVYCTFALAEPCDLSQARGASS